MLAETRSRLPVARTPASLRPLVRGPLRAVKTFLQWIRALASFGPASFLVRSPNIARELRAVSAGTETFKRAGGTEPNADYVLRRNTHRLEKGIISRPRRNTFATSYIGETVDHFVNRASAGSGMDDGSELAWSRDVLDEYFRIVGPGREVDEARAKYHAARSEDGESSRTRLRPYVRDLGAGPPVAYDALRDLSIRRRSVRWFDDRPVPRDLIDAAVAIAAQAPSACNRQPFEFYIYDEPADVQRVAAVPGGTVGFAHNFPVIAAVVGKLNAFFSERDRHIVYIDGSLAAMSFMFALETLGLSSCPINTPGEERMEEELVTQLGLEAYERPVMLIALGYPDPTGMVPRSQKKRLDDLRRYNP